MNMKHVSNTRIATLLNSAVQNEIPEMKDKVLAEAYQHIRCDAKQPVTASSRKGWVRYAVCLTLVAVVLGTAVVLPQNINLAPVSPKGVSSSHGTVAVAKQNSFGFVAYAAEANQQPAQLNKKIGIQLITPISVTGNDISYSRKMRNCFYQDASILKETGSTTEFAMDVGFAMKCVGENIDSITYTTNKGGFSQIVALTREQFIDPKKYNPALENVNGWAHKQDKSDLEMYGYLPLGKSYTISYADQDNYKKQYACRLVVTYGKAEANKMINDYLPGIYHKSYAKMDGTQITATVKFTDGSTSSKQMILLYDRDKGGIKATEK